MLRAWYFEQQNLEEFITRISDFNHFLSLFFFMSGRASVFASLLPRKRMNGNTQHLASLQVWMTDPLDLAKSQ